MTEGAGFVLVVDDDAVNRLLLTQAWSETAIACGRWRTGWRRYRRFAMDCSTACCWTC
jgi:CheY-like chemotaxis protein